MKEKKWYELLPWWGWLLVGFLSVWVSGITGGIPPLSFFGLASMIIGLCTGIGKLIESTRTKHH